MEVVFADDELDRLEIDPQFNAKLSQSMVRAFRKKMQAIRAAADERDLYRQRSFHFEALQGKRQGQCSIRLNDQYRLVFVLLAGNPGKKKMVKIICIEDYH